MISTWKPAWVCHWGLPTLLSPSWIPEEGWWENPTCILQGWYLEVYASTIVCVIFGEYLVNKLFCFCIWENIDVHPQQLVPPHLTVGIILDETTSIENLKHCIIIELYILPEPFLNILLLQSSVLLQIFKIFIWELQCPFAVFLELSSRATFSLQQRHDRKNFSSHKWNRTDNYLIVSNEVVFNIALSSTRLQ